MAAWGPVKELCEEATCSICLEYFKDPVMIAECGHNFCRACLTQSWGESGAEASCPQCRGAGQPGSLRPNKKLANFVDIAKKFTLERKEGEVKGAEGKEGVCEKHQEPLIFYCKDHEAPICVVCRRSKEHKDHQVTPLEEASQENQEAILAAGKARGACEKHQKPLKLFCKYDDALICVDCEGSQEHKYHDVIPLEEAAQELKDDISGFLKILKKEREKLLAFQSNVVKESQDLLKQTKADKQKTMDKFRKLRQFLDIQEKHLLAQVEEVEKELARKKDEHLVKLSDQLSSLESHIREMEEKIQQPLSELLQDVRSTLQRFKEEKFETPVVFPSVLKWKIWDFRGISHFLDGVMKPFKDTLVSGLQLQKANVTLDLGTAHPDHLLSEDRKSIRKKAQVLPKDPDTFDIHVSVLGCEGFTTGRYFWEINVGREVEWAVGVARRSLRRKGWLSSSPEGGIQAVGKVASGYVAFTHTRCYPLSLNGEFKRIRVVLNCDGGQVSFFDSDTAAHLYTFPGADFSGETLQPFFWVRGKGHLQLCP